MPKGRHKAIFRQARRQLGPIFHALAIAGLCGKEWDLTVPTKARLARRLEPLANRL